MELNKALKIILDLAEQNIINDPEMQQEMQDQWNAVQTVKLHMQELECPSPIKVVLVTNEFTPITETFSNVPVELSHSHDMGMVRQITAGTVTCDPQKVAQLIGE